MVKNTQNLGTQENDSAAASQDENKGKVRNAVRLMGLLRETTLAHSVNANGKDVISGRLTVSFGNFQSADVQFYAFRYAKDGKTETKQYTNLLQLLNGADGCITLAALFANNKDLTYDDAAKTATKVVIGAEMEEDIYVDRNNNKVSKTRLRGRFASRVKNNDTYVPSNNFAVQGYVLENMINPDTNRVTLTLGVPAYDGSVSKLKFITPEEDDMTVIKEGETLGQNAQAIATSVSSQFIKGTTATVFGYMCNAKLKSAPAPAPTAGNTFGYVPEEKTPYSKFVWENVVYGGIVPALTEGEPGSLTEKEIKDGLVIKETNFQKHQAARKAPGAPKSVAAGAAAPKTAPAAAKSKGFGGFGFAASTLKGTPTISEATPKAAPQVTPQVTPVEQAQKPESQTNQTSTDSDDISAALIGMDF